MPDQPHTAGHDRGRPAHRGPRPARPCGAGRLPQQHRRRQQVDPTPHDVQHQRQRERLPRADRVPGDQGTGQHGCRCDGQPEHRALVREIAVDVRAGLGGVHRVHEPRLERPGVQGAVDPHHERRRGEGPERVGQGEAERREHVEHPGREQDRSAAEGVGEAAGRQLQEQDRDPLGGQEGHHLRHGEAALQRDQRVEAEHQPDRQPTGRAQQQEHAPSRGAVQHGWDRGAHAGGARSVGAIAVHTSASRAAGSPSPAAR